ncbi:MAG: ribose-phosphate pyrophosphokinase [Chloroflexi bacterium]|nr:ribose-phosphate pyrophosphokinase [Chloroflexota bacterium]MCH7642362.1 ribose-phosphate pyrophosphokinase [Chloroflexota bacterium]
MLRWETARLPVHLAVTYSTEIASRSHRDRSHLNSNYSLGNLAVFSVGAHDELAAEICEYLQIQMGDMEVKKFRNTNTFVRILENVRSRDVYFIQPTAAPTNDNIMELLITIDAAKRASAGRITAVIPYYGYGRTDKKDQPRVPITGRLVADLLTTAGANRVVTVDLHAGQIQGFFNIPVDELTVVPLLVDYFLKKKIPDLVVAATDVGISKAARDVAQRLHAPLAIVEKRRTGNDDTTEVLSVIGEVRGRPVLTFDDEIDTGGSLVSAFGALKAAGATQFYATASHGIFSNGATDRICAVEDLIELVVTDTVPIKEEKRNPKLTVLQSCDLLGEAIYRIHNGLSVGAMFTY